MSFVEPLFLAGLLAAALPVVIHLINRRKAVRREFPALAFLLASQRKESRGIKVRQWLLMALRILIIALLAFSLAKPFVLSSAGVTASDRLPTATVFVVDTSYSMGNDDWWSNATEAFEARYDRLRPWDEVALVTTSPLDPRPVPRLTGNHSDVEDAFEELSPAEHTTKLLDALLQASEILSASELPNRKIVVLSDLARGGFDSSRQPDEPLRHEVEFVTVREGPAPNLAITGVDYEQEGTARDPIWRVEAAVRNFGEDDAKVEIRLLVGGTIVSAGVVEVEAGKSQTHTFRHKVEGTGIKEGVVELVDPDGLDVDDRRTFVVRLRDTIKTLLVNGEPSSIAFHDEMFFLERALNPRSQTTSNIVPELTTREGLEGLEIDEYDVVVLANVSKITPGVARKLQTFVENGGGLMLAMGDQVDVAAYNQHLGALLPKPLRGLKQLAERGDPDAPIKVTRMSSPRRDHPVFRVFQLPGGASLQEVDVYSYMLLEPSPPEQSQVALTYKDSAPALLERTVGRGRVMLFTSTVDDEWTELPYRPAFLPLMRRIVQYLARRATSAGQTEHLVAQDVTIEAGSMLGDRAVVTGPDDIRLVVEPKEGQVTFTPRKSGLYEVWAGSTDAEENRIDNLAMAVNVDTRESDLTPLSDQALAPWLGTEEAETARTRSDLPQKRRNLWPVFLFVVTLLLLAETILGTRRSVLAKIGRAVMRKDDPTLE